MNTGDPTLEVLRKLNSPDAMIFGSLDGNAPLALLDIQAKRDNRLDWKAPVSRAVFEELLHQGWIADEAIHLPVTRFHSRISSSSIHP